MAVLHPPSATKRPPPPLRYLHDMTILDENDLIRLLNAIQELSEQLSQSRSMSISLHASAGAVKVCRLLHTGNLQSLD